MADKSHQLGTDGAENLKLLMDYTKFHIGLYFTLFGAAVTAIEKNLFLQSTWPYLRVAALLFVLAEMCGGVIASSIPDAKSFADFQRQPLGVRWLPRFGVRYGIWAGLEHSFFWIAIVVTAVALLGPWSWRN